MAKQISSVADPAMGFSSARPASRGTHRFTDDHDRIADGNLGEFLKRLPGVSTGGSIDEVTTVRVRGASAAHTAGTLDGIRLPSTGGEKTGREFDVDKVAADYIESLEVIKSPTPDMDADAIGGTINLISRSAFDTRGRNLASQVQDLGQRVIVGMRGRS